MKKQWSYAHFPKGTICEVFVQGVSKEPREVHVDFLAQNGHDSYIIIDKRDDARDAVNISHVTRIIKRGEGAVLFDDHGAIESRLQYYIRAIPFEYKTPKSYVGWAQCLVEMGIQGFNLRDVYLDFEKLANQLIRERVLVEIELGYCTLFRANKKKLKAAVKRMYNKCLMTKKSVDKMEEEEDRRRWDEYEADLDAGVYDQEFREAAFPIDSSVGSDNY